MAYVGAVTEEHVKEILVAWYGDYNVKNIGVNEKVLIIVADALYQAQGCSSSMKWVPMGTNPIGAARIVTTAAVNYGKTIVQNAVGMQTYSMPCVKFTAREYKQEIMEAGVGAY